MKDEASLEYAETHRIALWTAIAVAFGILLHRLFFLAALAIALVAPVGWLWKREQQTARTH